MDNRASESEQEHPSATDSFAGLPAEGEGKAHFKPGVSPEVARGQEENEAQVLENLAEELSTKAEMLMGLQSSMAWMLDRADADAAGLGKIRDSIENLEVAAEQALEEASWLRAGETVWLTSAGRELDEKGAVRPGRVKAQYSLEGHGPHGPNLRRVRIKNTRLFGQVNRYVRAGNICIRVEDELPDGFGGGFGGGWTVESAQEHGLIVPS